MSIFRQPAAAAAAAITMVSLGALLNPPLAQSAPKCTEYAFPGFMAINQSNGYRVEFNQSGNPIGTEARAFGNDQQLKNTGWLEGDVTENRVDIRITWGSGESVGVYSGGILDNGRASGTTYDEANRASKAMWNSVQSLACA